MSKIRSICSLFSLLVGTCLSLPLFAGGILLYEISSADTGFASAGWSARAEDPSTLFTNPAGMTRLCGKQVEMGAQAIFSRLHFDPDSHTNVRGSDGDADIWLPSGSLFYVHPWNDKITVGLGSLGYFGADLVYNHHWVGRYYVQKTMLEGLSLVPAAAYKINDQWSIGAGLNVMYGMLKQRSAVHNLSDRLGDGYLNFHNTRFGCGGVFGVLFEPNCHTRFGIQYLTSVKLNFRARPKFHEIGPILRAILRDLGVLDSSIDLHVKVPQSVMASFYQRVNACWAVMGNIGWQEWSNFQWATVALADLRNRDLRIRHKYRDTWHVALGLEGQLTNTITLTGGVAYDTSAVSRSQRGPDFPIGKQWRFGTGARWNYSDRLTFDFSSELQWQGDLHINVNEGIVAGHVQGVYKKSYATFINLNTIYSF